MLTTADIIEAHMSHTPKTTLVPGATALGVCPNSQLMGGSFGKLYQCQNALSYLRPPLSPTTKAAGLNALADLRAARTELRRIKRYWRCHYELSELHAVLDLSSRTDRDPVLNSPYGSVRISKHLTHAFRRFEGYPAALKVECGLVKELSGLLRRRLIEDGFADSKMIDDQMAHDLGL